jgi:hypothetical protein
MTKVAALTSALLGVVVAVVVSSSANGACTLKGMEHVTISTALPPIAAELNAAANDDFDVLFNEAAKAPATDNFLIYGYRVTDSDKKGSIFGP